MQITNDPFPRNILTDKCRAAWIGFDDIHTEADWIWSDGGTMDNTTTEWVVNEPNDRYGNEDCAHISILARDKLLLNDLSCSRELSYICEIEI